MKKQAYRTLVFALSLMLALDTASAGRWMCGGWTPVCCEPVVVCEPVACCEPVDCCQPVDCCGESTHYTPSAAAPAAEPAYAGEELAPPPIPQVFDEGSFRSDNAAAPAVAIEAPPVVEEIVEPVADPADDFLIAPVEPMQEMPVAEPMAEPAQTPAEEDLFSEVADEPADDGWNAAASEPPAEKPMEDDLFAEEPTVVEDDMVFEEPMADEPAEDFSDDLFAEEPAEEAATEPAAEDDLFGGFAEEPVAEEPAAAPPEEPAAEDDLFGGFGDEPIEEPAAEPAATPVEDSVEDDLFGGFGDEPEDEPAVEESMQEDDQAPSEDDVEDDLFGGFGAILREPGGLDSLGVRTWVDNTGRYSCLARLVGVDGAGVRLMKQDGALSTVPLARLSQRDLEFVSRQASARHEAEQIELANRDQDDQPKQADAKPSLDGFRTAQR